MASATDFRLRGARQRWAVRLLFLFVVVQFLASVVIRKKIGEPYPGLFMPAFAGYGLDKMADGMGELTVCRVTIIFADATTKEMSLSEFCGRTLPAMMLPQQIFPRKGENLAQPLTPDLQKFLRMQAAQVIPNQTVKEITFRIYRESFRLDEAKTSQRTELLAERTVPL